MDIENGKIFLFLLQCSRFHDGNIMSPLVMVHNNSLSNAHHILCRCMITYIHVCVQSLSTHAYSHPPTHAHIHTIHLSNFIPNTFRNFPKTFPIVVVVFPIMINYDMNTYKLQYTVSIHSNFQGLIFYG